MGNEHAHVRAVSTETPNAGVQPLAADALLPAMYCFSQSSSVRQASWTTLSRPAAWASTTNIIDADTPPLFTPRTTPR